MKYGLVHLRIRRCRGRGATWQPEGPPASDTSSEKIRRQSQAWHDSLGQETGGEPSQATQHEGSKTSRGKRERKGMEGRTEGQKRFRARHTTLVRTAHQERFTVYTSDLLRRLWKTLRNVNERAIHDRFRHVNDNGTWQESPRHCRFCHGKTHGISPYATIR